MLFRSFHDRVGPLPGVPFIYQGEELALTDGYVPPEKWADPVVKHTKDPRHSRDGCRTPMLWEPVEGWGFTTAAEPWLPFGDRRAEESVAYQVDDPDSYLHRYRALIRLRNSEPDLHQGEFEWLTHQGPFLAYRRGGFTVVANGGDAAGLFSLPEGRWQIAFSTDRQAEGTTVSGDLQLEPAEALMLRAAMGS